MATKKEIFQKFLQENQMFIDFNGSEYTLFTQDNSVITVTNSPDELLQYIMGYNNCYAMMQENIDKMKQANKALHDQNNLNIQNYEKVILGMGGEGIKNETTESADSE
jgi:hypothetical protein